MIGHRFCNEFDMNKKIFYKKTFNCHLLLLSHLIPWFWGSCCWTMMNIHPRNRNIWVFQGLDHSSDLERMNTDFSSLLLFQFPQKVLPPQPRPSNQLWSFFFSPSSSYIVSFWDVAAKSWLSQKSIQERHPLANSIGSNPFSSDHFDIGRGLFQDPTMGSSVTTWSKVQFRKIELPILDLFILTVSLTFIPKWSTCEKLQFPEIFHIQTIIPTLTILNFYATDIKPKESS